MSVRPLSKELQQKAITDANEDPKRIPDDIKYIKKWISQSKHLKARTEDQWILSFLRGSKYSLERTKEKIDMHYTLKTLTTEFFGNRDPMSQEIQQLLDAGFFLVLPKTVKPDSPRILILRLGHFSVDSSSPLTFFKVYMMLLDILFNEDDQFIICGLTLIVDMEGMSMNILATIGGGIVKKAVTVFQKAYPARPKEIHFINVPTFFGSIYTIFKAFLDEKVLKKMIVHEKNRDDLYTYIPKEFLPVEYGGLNYDIKRLKGDLQSKVNSYRKWFEEDAKFGSNESKRHGKPKTSADIFGIEGSFRQLNVD